jgi:hypothetical protein
MTFEAGSAAFADAVAVDFDPFASFRRALPAMPMLRIPMLTGPLATRPRRLRSCTCHRAIAMRSTPCWRSELSNHASLLRAEGEAIQATLPEFGR